MHPEREAKKKNIRAIAIYTNPVLTRRVTPGQRFVAAASNPANDDREAHLKKS
jgi:hypothetical protein